MVEVNYLGHSTFLLSWGGKTVLTDPWLVTRPREVQRLVPPAATQDKLRKVDAIIVSHEHFDHCDPYDISMISGRSFAHVVAPPDALAHLENVNPRLKASVEEGDSFSLNGIELTVTPAKHPQSTNPVGYLLSAGNKTVYFAGDTYEFYDMVNIDVDLAILPIGGTFTMDSLGAVSALKKLRADYVVPMHYNTFPRIEADEVDFARRVEEHTRSKPVLLRPGERFEL
ncbi:MAG: metal-dependent hydrolase [Candidatus Micrarchaeia archaeon]